MRKLFILSVALMAAMAVSAKDAKQYPTSDEMTGNYRPYPWVANPAPALTPVPEGYVPFHIEHYGRHGSRWLINDTQYPRPIQILEVAERNGKLTPLGDSVMAVLRNAYEESEGRLGELTELGAIQHQGIAQRMYKNFPEVFAPGTHVDAKSTVVIRCILSMLNAVKELQALEPTLYVTTDASEHDMQFMNRWWTEEADSAKKNGDKIYRKPFEESLKTDGHFLTMLINDPQFAADSINSKALFNTLYSVLANTRAHEGKPWLVDRVYSPEEQFVRWQRRNASWFNHGGNSKLTNNIMPFTQKYLLKNMIESADSAVVSPRTSANLRYGHDGNVLPLVVMLGINGFDKEINSYEELAGQWEDFRAIPYAGNVQIIFMRPEGSTSPEDVIVKVLLNEEEGVLPIKPIKEGSPYYSWPEFRQFYMNRLETESF